LKNVTYGGIESIKSDTELNLVEKASKINETIIGRLNSDSSLTVLPKSIDNLIKQD